MRFDEIKITLKYKGKVVDGFRSKILLGKLPNPTKEGLHYRLEAAADILSGATDFPTVYGRWKFIRDKGR
jgi:hypothetical protein